MTTNKTTKRSGFTLPELMIVIAIVGILSGVSIANFSQRWAQERLLAASRHLQSWIDLQRRIAIQEGKACELSIDTTQAELRPSGSEINIDTDKFIPNACANQETFKIRDSVNNGSPIDLSIMPSNAKFLRFSFRGHSEVVDQNGQRLICTQESIGECDSLVLNLTLAGSTKKRCLKVISPLGIIKVGVGQSTSSNCSYSHSF